MPNTAYGDLKEVRAEGGLAQDSWLRLTGWAIGAPHTSFFFLGLAWLSGVACEVIYDRPLRRLSRVHLAVGLVLFGVAIFAVIRYYSNKMEQLELEGDTS